MKHEEWVEVYQRAVLPPDGRKMQERIVLARQALGECLQGLGDADQERQEIEETLRGLALPEAAV
jgi:hypothetical protein